MPTEKLLCLYTAFLLAAIYQCVHVQPAIFYKAKNNGKIGNKVSYIDFFFFTFFVGKAQENECTRFRVENKQNVNMSVYSQCRREWAAESCYIDWASILGKAKKEKQTQRAISHITAIYYTILSICLFSAHFFFSNQ